MSINAPHLSGRATASVVEPEPTEEDYRVLFDALREPLRIDMIRQIGNVDELPCTALDDSLPITRSTISYHIKVLNHAHLIDVRKEGRNYHYSLRRAHLDRLVPGFLERITTG
ncbi:helix-turn-helix transcriptional regulator [Conexibacter sp. CPCC 206217]|uniref:ArsR/SmtB family transcription factor n=1 Tax=Conexibacter sp. CPCC 206217 TaxID=3064574 RepID=UPI00271DF49D|nr:metalloregulator ArsR/SmtB family transcription factor [Conexibacter sp. CPCC 206217]MDO8210177.1 metalloregulator ArsR/SmtB family transcription factor [Conexibacter sp. CPCC 206217]